MDRKKGGSSLCSTHGARNEVEPDKRWGSLDETPSLYHSTLPFWWVWAVGLGSGSGQLV